MTSCADKESCGPSVMGRPTSSLHVLASLASIFLIIRAAEHLPKSGWKMSSSAGVQQTPTTFPSLREDRGHPGPWHSLPFPYLSSHTPTPIQAGGRDLSGPGAPEALFLPDSQLVTAFPSP